MGKAFGVVIGIFSALFVVWAIPTLLIVGSAFITEQKTEKSRQTQVQIEEPIPPGSTCGEEPCSNVLDTTPVVTILHYSPACTRYKDALLNCVSDFTSSVDKGEVVHVLSKRIAPNGYTYVKTYKGWFRLWTAKEISDYEDNP